jgi:small GTP-binding protein
MINILIVGRSGVGKSTLINAVFKKDLAKTGQGRPVTQDTEEITKDGSPFTIFDTQGLEMSKFQETVSYLEMLSTSRCSNIDSSRHIHVAWLCIQEDGRRVEDAEIQLHNTLAKHMPVITVITKARNDCGFENEVINLLPKSHNVVRVRAILEKMDDGQTIKPMGLVTLKKLTSKIV